MKTITVTLTEKEVIRIKDSLLGRAVAVGDAANAARMDDRDRDAREHSEYQSNLMDLYNNKFGEVTL